MNGHPSEYTSQPTGLSCQPALSIRTATPSTSQRGPTSSSPAKLPTTYPKPIHPAKLAKAVRLYSLYRYEEGLAQRHGPPHPDPLLSPATAQSVTSHSSRVYTPSVSTSAYDGLTDISSLVSFNEEESGPSGSGNGSTELIAYNGKRVKRRVRKPLSPIAKAKAALIRCLGSCNNCHDKRIPCPLEHHDIETLEKGRQSKCQKQRRHTSQPPSHSSVSASSRNAAESDSGHTVVSSGGSLGQSNSLLGLGQNEQLLQTFSTSTSDPQSLAGDPLAGIQAQGTAPLLAAMADGVEISRFFPVNPYQAYQDGQMLALGVLREYYVCQHLDGLCEQLFETPDALEEHFESAHFEFTRLKPSLRYICSKCNGWNSALTGRCQQCHAGGPIEVWIYGNYIRPRFQPRFPSDGQYPFKMESPSVPTFLSYDPPGTESPFGAGPGDVTGFNGGMDPSGYNYGGHNAYQAPNAPSYGFDAYGPPTGPYHTHGSRVTECQSFARSSPLSISYWYSKALQSRQLCKVILGAILLLVSLAAIVKTHQWLLMNAQGFEPRPVLPAIGFAGVLVSFVVGYCFWSVKHFGVPHGVHGVQCRPRRCPLHDLPTFAFDCGATRPPIHVSVNGG